MPTLKALFQGKELTMSDLTTRADDFSFQIMAESSARFFVRVSLSDTNKTSMVFSDFILNPDDDNRAVEALHLLKRQGFPLVPAMKLVFQNIHPSYSDESDRAELVRRHDQIVSVLNDYAAQTGCRVDNAFLEPSGKKFETMVLVE